MPLALDYLVQPGDTLSEIAEAHHTSVRRIVARNHLPASGDLVVAGQRLAMPGAATGSKTRSGSGSGSPGPGARRIRTYTVRPGDTATGLAVRFHAWTDELIKRNHLGDGHLRVGQRLRIPVVLAALDEGDASGSGSGSKDSAGTGPTRDLDTHIPRARVRRIIETTARRHGVDPQLALAVSWQEAGWRQHHVSSARAVGAMQVLPETGRWMSEVLGRDLDLRRVHDNVTAGVVLLRTLGDMAGPRDTVAAYYQGLGAVREHGYYADTKRYVANVMALRHRFDRGDYPE